MKIVHCLLICVLLSSCASTSPVAPPVAPRAPVESNMTSTDDLAAVRAALDEAPGAKTLLVLDIDDTLLTSPSFYGSDAWYEWQVSPQTPSSDKVSCLFDMIAMNTEVGTQKPTQGDGPALVNPLIQRYPTILLTSRNPAARAATLRELAIAQYALPAPLDGKPDGIMYRYLPDPTAKPVTVTYDQGLFMTQGQNKGLVLLNLMSRLGLTFDRVVLVDDGEKNHVRMQKALGDAGIRYRGLLYTKINKEVDAARRASALAATQQWNALLQNVFQGRQVRLQSNACAY